MTYILLTKTFVTPELRDAVRDAMRGCRVRPTDADSVEHVRALDALIPVIADTISDADIDAAILQTLLPAKRRSTSQK